MQNLADLQENFALFDDWEERYSYLIDLGKNLPEMDEALKNDETLVKGCTSRVWMVCHQKDDSTYQFIADSDAHIVRGLIALVLAAYQGKTAEEIGLDQHLSPNRRNGFFAMVERVRALASA